jgi:hypothetical protein
VGREGEGPPVTREERLALKAGDTIFRVNPTYISKKLKWQVVALKVRSVGPVSARISFPGDGWGHYWKDGYEVERFHFLTRRGAIREFKQHLRRDLQRGRESVRRAQRLLKLSRGLK